MSSVSAAPAPARPAAQIGPVPAAELGAVGVAVDAVLAHLALQRFRPALAGAHPHDRVDRDDQTLPSPIRPVCAALTTTSTTSSASSSSTSTSMRSFGHQVDGVLRAAVDLGVTALAAVAGRLRDGHAVDTERPPAPS